MNRAEKGWETRYLNEIAILTDKMNVLSDELYKLFLEFVNKTGKFQDMNRELDGLQKELSRFQEKHKGGSSSE
jgi:archaellum component FlaC